MRYPKERLEELRTELRGERISYGELFELQSLVEHIDSNDVELLQAAGVPENNQKIIRNNQKDLVPLQNMVRFTAGAYRALEPV